MTNGEAIYSALSRRDKFQLSGGKLMFAPRYPAWLESPGYWDEIYYHDEELKPVFTWSVLSDNGSEIKPSFKKRRWQPGRSITAYNTGTALKLFEERFITPESVLASNVTLKNRDKKPLDVHLIFWTRLPHEQELPRLENINADINGIRFIRRSPGRRGELETAWLMKADKKADSFTVANSERFGLNPEWLQTPFASNWTGKLPSSIEIQEQYPWGAIWPALHFAVHIEPQSVEQIGFFCSISKPETDNVLIEALGEELSRKTRQSWLEFFEGVPQFESSDELWNNLYRYRWYLLRHNLKTGGGEKQPYDGICEGSEIFHQPISYSTPPIVFDLSWHHDPGFARNTLLNFSELQEEDGRLPGALHHDRFRKEFFYHADWGRAVARLHRIHPDKVFLNDIYPALSRYGHWLKQYRDPDISGMIDILNHMETGQEFNSRYLPANSDFDGEGWEREFRLKGVDSTVYAYFLWQALEEFAVELGNEEDKKLWATEKSRTAAAILKNMWLKNDGMFSDVLPDSMKTTGVKTLTNFYPYLTDLTGSDHLAGIHKILLNPAEFWTPAPAATLSQSDPFYSADAKWKGKARNCTWNGRVWPMTNSHIVEALAGVSALDPSLRFKTAELLQSFARLFDAEGDQKRLSSFEHYHPLNASPCKYRGIDDYLHCWIIDLIIRYVAGFHPHKFDESITIDPFPLGIQTVLLKSVPYRGSHYDLHIEKNRAELKKDGEIVSTGKLPLVFRAE